jgi:hypothetical protein
MGLALEQSCGKYVITNEAMRELLFEEGVGPSREIIPTAVNPCLFSSH